MVPWWHWLARNRNCGQKTPRRDARRLGAGRSATRQARWAWRGGKAGGNGGYVGSMRVGSCQCAVELLFLPSARNAGGCGRRVAAGLFLRPKEHSMTRHGRDSPQPPPAYHRPADTRTRALSLNLHLLSLCVTCRPPTLRDMPPPDTKCTIICQVRCITPAWLLTHGARPLNTMLEMRWQQHPLTAGPWTARWTEESSALVSRLSAINDWHGCASGSKCSCGTSNARSYLSHAA